MAHFQVAFPGRSQLTRSSAAPAYTHSTMLRGVLRRVHPVVALSSPRQHVPGLSTGTKPSLGSYLSRETPCKARRGLAAGATGPGAVNGSGARGAKEDRQRALDDVLKDIDGRFGKGTIWKLGESHSAQLETFTSGVLPLDSAMGGGYPRGRIVEIYGPESSGKTTLALHAIAEMQKAGGTAALVDAEHAFEPTYAKNLGVNLDELLISQPFSGEDALNIVDSLVRSMAVDVIAVDSVAALVPRAELEGEIGQVQMGAQARLMSSAMRKLAGNASKCNCTVIFLNQLRQKIGVVYGNPEITSGGNALKYYASVRIDVRRKETLKEAGEETGIRCKASIKKNKVAPPYRVAEFDINFGSGISQLGGLLDSAVAASIVSRKGAWYSYGETKLGMGKGKVLQYLAENPTTRNEIEMATREAVRGGKADAGFESGDLSGSVDGDDEVLVD